MIMKYTGITLIELIVTLAVLSLLLAIGVPQFSSSTANSRLTTAINSLSGDLSFARTEAVKRAIPTTVTAVNVSDWAGGWIVATVAINASTPAANLRISPALTAGATIVAGVSSVQFNSDGRSNSAAALTFILCDDRSGTFGKRVTLNATGQTFLTTKIQCN